MSLWRVAEVRFSSRIWWDMGLLSWNDFLSRFRCSDVPWMIIKCLSKIKIRETRIKKRKTYFSLHLNIPKRVFD